jgi:hypothetical protein
MRQRACRAQWRILILTTAIIDCLVETEIQIGWTPDDRDMQQPPVREISATQAVSNSSIKFWMNDYKNILQICFAKVK